MPIGSTSNSSIQRITDRPSFLIVYTVLLFLLFTIVFYDKVDETEQLSVALEASREELTTLEKTMVDIIQEETERRETQIKKRIDERNK